MRLDEPSCPVPIELGHHLRDPWYTSGVSRALETACTLALFATAACYSAPKPDCGFVCGPDGACPEDYTCGPDNRCRRNGTPASLMCTIDAPASPRDAAPDGPTDAPIDAPPDAPPDVTPPMLVTSTPPDAATDVARDATITVELSEPVVGVSASTFTVVADAAPVDGTVSATSATIYVFTPDTLLPEGAPVTVRLDGAITDEAGNALSPAPTTFTFQTGS